MVGKAHYVCMGKDKHILRLSIPDGETADSFSKKEKCPLCDSELFWAKEFNQ